MSMVRADKHTHTHTLPGQTQFQETRCASGLKISVHYIFYVLIQLIRYIVLALIHVHVLLLHSDYNVLCLMQGCLKQATVIMYHVKVT